MRALLFVCLLALLCALWRLSQLGPEHTAARAEEVKARGRKLALEPLSLALLEATR